MRASRLLAGCLLVITSSACPHRPPSSSAKAGGGEASEPSWKRTRGAFGFDARLARANASSHFKMRFYAQAPDQFRLEVRGAVGGIALVATGSDGKVRILVPSRRVYAEALLSDDIGTDLLGLPLSGCDLAMVMRISSGMARFRPCRDPLAADPEPAPTDRPGLIVDTGPTGEELVQFGWDWSSEGEFPREMRVILPSEAEETWLALTRFAAVPYPQAPPPDFFWEPLPEGAVVVPVGRLGADSM